MRSTSQTAIALTKGTSLPRAFLAGLTVIALTACGGGGGDDGSAGGGPDVWVSIASPNADTTVTASVANFDGRAYCPECPPTTSGNASICQNYERVSFGNAVRVSWTNRNTGTSGTALNLIAGSCDCSPFFGCVLAYERRWSASVPVEYGVNVIEITATQDNGDARSASRSLVRVTQAPTNVTAAAGQGQATVSWSNLSDATSYNVYWSTSRVGYSTGGTKIANASNPHVHTGLQNDVTYYYRVTAERGGGESPRSEIALATAGWSNEAVGSAAGDVALKPSIAVDGAGNPHIHYGHSDPANIGAPGTSYYSTRIGGIWNSVQVDSPRPYAADFYLDSFGVPHAAYKVDAGLKHAFYSTGVWTAEVVSAGQTICALSLAPDATGNVHLAYRVAGLATNELRYATNASGVWISSTVHSYSRQGCGLGGTLSVDLAVDASGAAHIFYSDYGGNLPALRYATNQGGPWIVSILEQGDATEPSAAIDSNGKFHVAYLISTHLRYAQNITGTWSIEDTGNVGQSNYLSLAVDGAGNPHIGYFSYWTGELLYATKVAGTWRRIVIEDTSGALSRQTDTAIAVDVQGKIHLVYFSAKTGELRYTTNRP